MTNILQPFKIHPQPKQFDAYEKWIDDETLYVLFGGGAGGGKSWWVAEKRLFSAVAFPGHKAFIARKELTRLMKSSYVTFQKVCKHYGVKQDRDWRLNNKYNYIEFSNGSRIDLLDADYKPADPDFDRFGSLEYTDGDIEEAQEVKEKAFDVLKARVGRHMNADFGIRGKIGLTCNPNKGWLYRVFYKPWRENKLDPRYAFIQALYKDNRYTAEEYGRLLSEIKDNATRQRLRDGVWEYDDDDNVLVEYDAILDLFTNVAEESKHKYLSGDVARYGSDKVRIGLWKGLNLYRALSREKQGVDKTATQGRTILRAEKIPHSHAVWDDDGVGGGVVDLLPGVKGFVNNSAPLENFRGEKDNFENLRAQCGYLLADKINNREIAITAKLSEEEKQMIIEELEQLKSRDADQDGKKKLIKKEDIKEAIGRSPDWLDMLLMRMLFEVGTIPKDFIGNRSSRRSAQKSVTRARGIRGA